MRARRGSILIVVMFVLTAFALLAVTLSYRVGLASRSARNRGLIVQLRANASSAVEIAIAGLVARSPEFDHPAQGWRRSGDLSDGTWVPEWSETAEGQPTVFATGYEVVDEQSKLHLLYASSEALRKIGMSDEQIGGLLDWMDADDDQQPQGAENGWYQSLPSGYRCKNQPLDLLDELLLVRGFSAADYLGAARSRQVGGVGGVTGASAGGATQAAGLGELGWLDLLTCCGDGRINLNTAPPGVLATLPLSQGAVDQIVGYRAFDEFSGGKLEDHAFKSGAEIDQLQGLTDPDKEVLKQLTTGRSSHFRIFSQSRHLPTGLAVRLEVLVRVEGDKCQVLQWKTGM